MFERYLKNTIRVWPSNSVCNFVFPGRILPSLHLLAIRSGCIAPRRRRFNCCQQHGDLSRIGFLGHLLRGDIQFKSLNPPPSPVFGRVPLKRQIFGKLEIFFHFFCGSNYSTPFNIQQISICLSKAGLVARQLGRVTYVTTIT